jgi:hypothetical protein
MNERIEELWDKAAEDTMDNSWQSQTKFMERFAELIVLECTKAVMDGTKEGDHYAQRIEEHFDNGPGGILHFGVEESRREQIDKAMQAAFKDGVNLSGKETP